MLLFIVETKCELLLLKTLIAVTCEMAVGTTSRRVRSSSASNTYRSKPLQMRVQCYENHDHKRLSWRAFDLCIAGDQEFIPIQTYEGWYATFSDCLHWLLNQILNVSSRTPINEDHTGWYMHISHINVKWLSWYPLARVLVVLQYHCEQNTHAIIVVSKYWTTRHNPFQNLTSFRSQHFLVHDNHTLRAGWGCFKPRSIPPLVDSSLQALSARVVPPWLLQRKIPHDNWTWDWRIRSEVYGHTQRQPSQYPLFVPQGPLTALSSLVNESRHMRKGLS